MPQLDEMLKERNNKKFAKKSYRPWDLSGEFPSTSKEEPKDTKSMNSFVVISNGQINVSPLDQISSALDTAPISKKDIELDNNKETIEQQQDNKQVSFGDHLDNTKISSQITNGEQLDITLDPTSLYHQLMKLSGIQKNILDFVVDFCTFRNNLETGPVETLILASYVKATTGVVKISLKRLIDKGFIIRNKGKQAKGGYINLSITSDVYNAIIDHRKKLNTVNNPMDFINSVRYQLDNTESYNSSSYNKNITTIKEDLPKEWMEIEYEALQSIGFGKTQIKQLIGKNEPSIVQESINHFAFGFEYNSKFKKYTDPLNVLMGVLRKGQGWFEKDYRSPKEIAQQKLLEIKKAEIERKKEMDEEAYKIALSEWLQTLNSEEIEIIAPNKTGNGRDLTPRPAKLSLYFKENIWPEKRAEYLN